MSFFKGVASRIRKTFSASYKPPPEDQIKQIERGEAWFREFDWESFMGSYFAGTRFLPGAGLGLVTYPYVSIWEKIWGAVTVEDYSKYREYATKDPFIRATLDLHTMMAVSQGFELDYPIDMVVEDVMNFLRKHDFFNLLKILVKDCLLFGNSYCEIVRVWMCPHEGHDMQQLQNSYETELDTGQKIWWTDRMEVAEKHKEMYPDHEMINPYGEIVRLKPLDPYFMRVRRDPFGQILGYAQLYAVPIVTFFADEILHLRYMPSTEMYSSVYGESILRPIIYHEELLKEYEETVSQIMKVYIKPMFLVKVGSPTGGPEVTAEQFRQIMQTFSSRKPGSDIFVRTTGLITDVQPISPPISGLQTTQFWLEWLHNQRAYALTVPKHFTDPAGLNKATATIVQEAYFTFIQSIRNSISTQLEQQLFPKILYSLYGKAAETLMNEYGVPRIIWKPVKEESFATKVPLVINLRRAGLISVNEGRAMLGLKPKEEYEEEYEETGDILPLTKPKIAPSPEETEAEEEGKTEEETKGEGKVKEDQVKRIIDRLRQKL
ncbi:MAG: phage portal protein [Fervidobacterium sp.]